MTRVLSFVGKLLHYRQLEPRGLVAHPRPTNPTADRFEQCEDEDREKGSILVTQRSYFTQYSGLSEVLSL